MEDTNNSQELSHDEQMIAKVDAKQAEVDKALQGDVGDLQPSDEPELIGGKFKSQEDLLKAYKELESKLGQPKEGGDPVSQDETPSKGGLDIETPSEAQDAVDKAGLDMASLYTEYQSNGELSPESYEALAKAGIDEQTVNAYIEGQNAKRTLIEMEVKKEVGGEAEYTKMLQWASKNLSEAEIAEYNKPMNAEQYRNAVDSLYGKYVRQNGRSPNLVNATSASSGSTVGYQTRSEMMKDINNPKYKTDATFRNQVQTKIGLSKVL